VIRTGDVEQQRTDFRGMHARDTRIAKITHGAGV